MATASAGRAALVTDQGSSFNSFRIHQFADDVRRANASSIDIQQTPATYSSQLAGTEPMAQVPRPPSGQNPDRMPSIAPSRPMKQDHNRPNSSSPHLGALELVELASNPLVEGILGPNKDGRVRNPVPSKLKGKTDNKQGNFGVMHMGMSPGGKKADAQGKDAAAERDAAARRTSENTASRAKAAQSEKYVPPKKRGLEVNLGDQTANRGSPFAVSREQRARPLAPDETKSEQARLLTLLWSISPVTVVDQICKAVAYFGGIPGAPPPEDGIFPESANTRETGALFIGWLAEIFPDLSAKSPEAAKGTAGGRKKGGKGKVVAPGAEGSSLNEAPNSRNGYGFGPAISAPAWGLPQSLALVNTPVPAVPIPLPEVRQGASSITEQKPFEQPSTTPAKQQPDENPNSNASASKRRRGRPKGSRNKGRSEGPQGSDGVVNNVQSDGHDQVQQASQSPEVHAAAAKVAQPKQAPPEPSFLPTPINLPQVVPKQAATISYPQQPWQNNSHQSQVGQTDHTATIPPADELSPEERAVLEAFRNHGPEGMNIVPSPVVPAKATPAGGQKRKRAPPKPKLVAVPAPSFPAANSIPVQNTGSLPPTGDPATTMNKDAMQWAHVDSSTPSGPPTKKPRQRKPKAGKNTNEPPSRNNTASVASATPPVAPSTIPDSQATSSSQQSLPVTRAPAEGLEAHYERFANLSNQQNGRSHTPTMLQQQQQRQQSKPTSVPSQQSTPQLQQQQMQQQKSQQGSQQGNQQTIQREDQKLAQTGTARPSSATYYNQRSQASNTYSQQQYPSHQPSQLYGTHQPSPQMSNNSYRTSSSHTLSQASPQFSQAENTYRTASPHSIAQPSPSFSHPDTNYRTNSTHTLAQPSPSYSQAETSYRAPSTHSMTQPTSSYTSSRSQTQAQPSHQNHYGHFSDFSSLDLPTPDSLGHSGSTSTANVLSGGPSGWAGQSMTAGLGVSSRSSTSRNSLYGTNSSLSNPYDAGTHDVLRGVSRPTSNVNPAFSSSSTGLGNTFDTSGQDLLGGIGRR